MNITQTEIEKLRQLVAEGVKKHGAVSITDRPATNCYSCGGRCSNFCTDSCNNYCDGNSGMCWKTYRGR